MFMPLSSRKKGVTDYDAVGIPGKEGKCSKDYFFMLRSMGFTQRPQRSRFAEKNSLLVNWLIGMDSMVVEEKLFF
jgi:hypothetical protein